MNREDPNERKQKERWKRLLVWMKTKGFDVSQLCVEPRTRKGARRGLFATRTLHPSKKAFLTIPATALLNIRTLSPVYPTISLEGFTDTSNSERLVINGTQLLSIHLALYRPVGDSSSKDPLFGPYIDSLPGEFDSHPLTWIVEEKLGQAAPHEAKLLLNLPPSVMNELQSVAKRFWQDWDVVEKAKKEYLEELKSKNEALFDVHDFLWGWLVGVATKCLYSDIFRRKLPLSNLTLCPIIDLSNHTKAADLPRATWKDAPRDNRPRRGGELLKAHDYVFLPPEQVVNEGEELYLKYGEHSNRSLFVEYGFVDENSDWEVDVSDLVDELIIKKGTGSLVKELLPEVAHQFMSDLKLYAVPQPSHASWSLHCVLRLANLEFSSNIDLNPGSVEVEKVLEPWRRVVFGEADVVSDANESLASQDLESICRIILDRSSEGISRLEDEESEGSIDECGWYSWARGCVVKLWAEEAQVAQQVMDSVAKDRV